eukprot:SAG11_NODE_275_length_11309_cov_6.090901_11_plen_108_part_00
MSLPDKKSLEPHTRAQTQILGASVLIFGLLLPFHWSLWAAFWYWIPVISIGGMTLLLVFIRYLLVLSRSALHACLLCRTQHAVPTVDSMPLSRFNRFFDAVARHLAV